MSSTSQQSNKGGQGQGYPSQQGYGGYGVSSQLPPWMQSYYSAGGSNRPSQTAQGSMGSSPAPWMNPTAPSTLPGTMYRPQQMDPRYGMMGQFGPQQQQQPTNGFTNGGGSLFPSRNPGFGAPQPAAPAPVQGGLWQPQPTSGVGRAPGPINMNGPAQQPQQGVTVGIPGNQVTLNPVIAAMLASGQGQPQDPNAFSFNDLYRNQGYM